MTKLGPVPRLDKTLLYINILSISMAEHKVKLQRVIEIIWPSSLQMTLASRTWLRPRWVFTISTARDNFTGCRNCDTRPAPCPGIGGCKRRIINFLVSLMMLANLGISVLERNYMSFQPLHSEYSRIWRYYSKNLTELFFNPNWFQNIDEQFCSLMQRSRSAR